MRKKREKKIVFGNLNAAKHSSASLLYIIIAAWQIPRVNSLYRVKTPVLFPERKWTTMEQKNAIKLKDSWDFSFLYELLWLSKPLAKSNVNLSCWKKRNCQYESLLTYQTTTDLFPMKGVRKMKVPTWSPNSFWKFCYLVERAAEAAAICHDCIPSQLDLHKISIVKWMVHTKVKSRGLLE